LILSLIAGGDITEIHKHRLQELQKDLKNKESIAHEAIKKMQIAEKDAEQKDKSILDLTSRMRRYETVIDFLCDKNR